MSLEERSNQQLARWQAEGDLEALDQLLRTEVRILKRGLQANDPALLTGSLGATDATQEAILALLSMEKPPVFDSPASLRAYLRKSARRLLVHRLRRRNARVVPLDPVSSARLEELLAVTGGAQAAQDASDRSTVVDMAFTLILEEEREIIQLVYFEGLDIAAAAARLGIGRSAANMRLVRARGRLAEKIVDWAELIE